MKAALAWAVLLAACYFDTYCESSVWRGQQEKKLIRWPRRPSARNSINTTVVGVLVGFELIDATLDVKLLELTNGTVIALDSLTSGASTIRPALSIQAVVQTPTRSTATTTNARIQSVQFIGNISRVEQTAPFALCGNKGRDYAPCPQLVDRVGTYVIQATPFAGRSATGKRGATIVVSFTVVKTATNPAPVRAPTLMDSPVRAPTSTLQPPESASSPVESPVSAPTSTLQPPAGAPISFESPDSAPTSTLQPPAGAPIPFESPVSAPIAPLHSAPVTTPTPPLASPVSASPVVMAPLMTPTTADRNAPVVLAAPHSNSAVTTTPTNAPVPSPTVPLPSTSRPVVVDTQAPIGPNAPAAAPVAPARLTVLEGCYLRNLQTKVDTLLTGNDAYTITSTNTKGYSIRCDVINGLEPVIFIKFYYNGLEHDEFGEPRWLDGDSDAGAYIVPVSYLSTCGSKTVSIEGRSWSKLHFTKTFSLTADCPGASTTKAPMAPNPNPVAPAAAPVSTELCAIPKLVGSWSSGTAHPFPVAEAQGAMIGQYHTIVGGFRAGYEAVSNETHTLDTSNPNAKWVRQDDYPFPIGVTHGAFVVVGTQFYMCGGYAGGGIGMHTDICMVYDHSKPKGTGQQWSLFTPLPDTGRAGGHMIYDSTLHALVYSGGATRPIPNKRTAVDHTDTWIYSLNSPSLGWVKKADMPFHANHMSAVTAKDNTGKEHHYFTGGQEEENEHDGNVSDHYEYDAIYDIWYKRAFMPIPRSHHASSTRAIGCGFILVAGATNGGKKISDISYYDVPTDTWTKIGDLPNNMNTPVCDINVISGVLYCDTGWDSGNFSKKIKISL